jgi:hypothetical protein
MMSASAHGRRPSWPLILADLALILFLIALTGLSAAGREADPGVMTAARGGSRMVVAEAAPDAAPDAAIAPAQSLYRPVPDGPGLREWLAGQPRDPRATLTIFARYAPGEEAAAWARANALAQEAADSGVALRTILTRGKPSDIYASLAYDALAEPLEPAR